MIDRELISQWVTRQVITEDQAVIMRRDIEESRKETSSNNIIVTLSTVGAIVLGAGILLFVASNWEVLSSFVKVSLLLLGTYSTLALGYACSYRWKNYIRVGAALILLSTILYCATVFLVAQIYHINANSHWLILFCLVGIAPLVYTIRSNAFAFLFLLGLYIWLGFIGMRSYDFGQTSDSAIALPALFLVTSILLFFLGGFHYRWSSLAAIARTYRLVGIHLTLLILLLFTFQFISGKLTYIALSSLALRAYGQLTITTIIVAVTAVMAALFSLRFNPAKSHTITWESILGITLSFVVSMFLLSSRSTDLFTYLFSLLFIVLISAVMVIGYQREDMNLINAGITYTSLFILIRYFDFFWDLLDRSVFFIIGGIILIGGGVVLERQRRKLKQQFTHT